MIRLDVTYERELATRISDACLRRLTPGLYVSAIDGVIWKGFAVSLISRSGELWVAPALGIYCPKAYKIMKMVFREMGNRGFETGAMSQRMGVPFIIEPLHVLADRSSLSYNIRTHVEIHDSVSMLYKDFCLVQANFFGTVENIDGLISRTIRCQSGNNPSAGINAMALSLAADGNISVEQLRSYEDLYQSPITSRFLGVMEGMVLSKRNNE